MHQWPNRESRLHAHKRHAEPFRGSRQARTLPDAPLGAAAATHYARLTRSARLRRRAVGYVTDRLEEAEKRIEQGDLKKGFQSAELAFWNYQLAESQAE